MSKKILIRLFAVVIFIILGWFGYQRFFVQKRVQQGANELTSVIVRLKWLHQAQFAGNYLAKEKGFYNKAGLDVTLKEYEFGVSKVGEVARGDVHFSIVTPVGLLKAIDRGLKIRALAVIYQDSPYALACLKESGIKTPADFRGKVLGNEGGIDEAIVIYQALMNRYGVSKDEVTFKNLNFDEAEDLAQKRADVIELFRTDQTYLLDKKGIEYNLLLPEQFGFKMYEDVLITSQKLIDEDANLVRRFVQATLKGWEYALNNKEEAIEITLKYANPIYQSREHELYILNNSIPLIKPTGGQKIGSMNYIRWRRIRDAMASANLLKNELDITKVYTSRFLK